MFFFFRYAFPIFVMFEKTPLFFLQRLSKRQRRGRRVLQCLTTSGMLAGGGAKTQAFCRNPAYTPLEFWGVCCLGAGRGIHYEDVMRQAYIFFLLV